MLTQLFVVLDDFLLNSLRFSSPLEFLLLPIIVVKFSYGLISYHKIKGDSI